MTLIFWIHHRISIGTTFEMQSKAFIALLACLCLAYRTDAFFFNFGDILRTVAVTADGVSHVINGFLRAFSAEQLGFQPDVEYKPLLISVNALCQMTTPEGIKDSDDRCEAFGKRYFSDMLGSWACGSLRKNEALKEYGCMLQLSAEMVAQGVQVPEVIFRRDEW